MTHTTNDAPVTVEQCDRDRAWPHRPYFMTDTVATVRAWDSGQYDDQRIIQAFARHRLAALASAPAGDGFAAFEAAAIEAERIGSRWAEDTDHPATSRSVGKAIATSIRALPLARPHSAVAPAGDGVEATVVTITVKSDGSTSFHSSIPTGQSWADTCAAMEVAMQEFRRQFEESGKCPAKPAALVRPRAAVGEREA